MVSVVPEIVVRLPNELLVQLDALVDRDAYSSRAIAVQAGIEMLIEAKSRRPADREPMLADAETPAARASLHEAIAEEPW
jgi:Arc/MetJ-type ribon-helix-helix transcriptional regulator